MRSLFFTLHRGVQKYKIRELTKASVATAFGLSLFAQVAIADGAAPPGPAPKTDPKTWAGIGWGLGVAADFYVRGRRVVDAQIISGSNIVRVTDESANVGVSFVLEAHYFVSDVFLKSITGKKAPGECTQKAYSADPNCTEVASGPFVAIEIGGGTKATTDAGPITGYALGWMWGLHHPGLSVSNASSWNLGIGFRVDPQAKVPGDGFIANQPPPPGETAVRFKTEPRYGLMLLSSFSF